MESLISSQVIHNNMNLKSKWKNLKKLKLWFKKEKVKCTLIDNKQDSAKNPFNKEIKTMQNKMSIVKDMHDLKDCKSLDNWLIIYKLFRYYRKSIGPILFKDLIKWKHCKDFKRWEKTFCHKNIKLLKCFYFLNKCPTHSVYYFGL